MQKNLHNLCILTAAIIICNVQLQVWAKCETTKREGWKSILAYHSTEHDEVFDLSIDATGDGHADETLTSTAEHPFWVEDTNRFLPLGKILPGMRLHTANATGTATVVSNTSKRGPPGETFTTYNLEVEGFHTYFVGNAGVWVHNTCAARQMDLFDGLGHHARNFGSDGYRNLEANRFQAMRNMRDQQFHRSQIGGQHWSRFAAENTKMMLAE